VSVASVRDCSILASMRLETILQLLFAVTARLDDIGFGHNSATELASDQGRSSEAAPDSLGGKHGGNRDGQATSPILRGLSSSRRDKRVTLATPIREAKGVRCFFSGIGSRAAMTKVARAPYLSSGVKVPNAVR